MLPAFDHLSYLPDLRAFGVQGLEIAPDHSWPRPHFGQGFSIRQIETTRRMAQLSGLQIIGLHSLLGGRPELGIFDDAETRHHTIEHLVHLSEVCRDLGGRTLILDARWSRALATKEAWLQCRAFLEKLLPRIEEHGTVLCFRAAEPGGRRFLPPGARMPDAGHRARSCVFWLARRHGGASRQWRDWPHAFRRPARPPRPCPISMSRETRPARRQRQGRSRRHAPPSERHQLRRLAVHRSVSCARRLAARTGAGGGGGFKAIYLNQFRSRRPFHV